MLTDACLLCLYENENVSMLRETGQSLRLRLGDVKLFDEENLDNFRS